MKAALATVSFANSTGGVGSYLYSYDFNNDGTFEIVNSTSPTATVPAQYLSNPGNQVVHGRITDMTGAFADYTTTITVHDVPPTVSLNGQYSGTPGTAVTFAATVTDPSPAVTAAGFTYLWSFGDGATSTLATPTHVYAATGAYTTSVTVTDEYGEATTTTAPVNISTASGSTRYFAFGGTGTTPSPNYTLVTNLSNYSAVAGFGWQSGSVTAAAGTDITTNATFALNLPNGTYQVSALVGDPAAAAHPNADLRPGVVFGHGEHGSRPDDQCHAHRHGVFRPACY